MEKSCFLMKNHVTLPPLCNCCTKIYAMSWQSLEERLTQAEELYDCKDLIKGKKKKINKIFPALPVSYSQPYLSHISRPLMSHIPGPSCLIFPALLSHIPYPLCLIFPALPVSYSLPFVSHIHAHTCLLFPSPTYLIFPA